MEIIVDNRESRKILPKMFDSTIIKYNLPITVKYDQLTVSDFAFMYDGKIVALIERKSIKDLADTIKDNNRKYNYRKMLSVSDKVFYIIEGSRFKDRQRKVARVPVSSLQTHLDHLIFDHNIHIIYSANPEDTVERLVELYKNILSSEKYKTMDKKGGMGDLKRVQKKTDDTILLNVFQSPKGISQHIAYQLANIVTIKQILDKEINTDILYPSGKKMKVDKIYKFFSQHEKIIASMPGISKNTAMKILSQYTIEQLLEMSDEEGRKLKLNEKRNLCSIYDTIKKYLTRNLTTINS